MNEFERQIEKNNENRMVYPDEFITKCEKLYRNNKRIMTLLHNNSFLLGIEIKKRALSVISDSEITSASTTAELKRVQRKLREKKLKEELYKEWFDLYDEQYLKYGRAINSVGLVTDSSEIKLDYNIRHGVFKRGERITRAQLQDSVNNLASRLEQNAERRRIGSDRAGEYRTS